MSEEPKAGVPTPPDREAPGLPEHPIVPLDDGTQVLLRLLTPADREAVEEAFRRLSPDSRYYRFWSQREQVSESLLHRFLNPEPGQHETWVAQDPARPLEPGYGGGSYWRSTNHPHRAEMSFVVADEAQHRGVGTLMLALIWVRARRLGITELYGHVLPDNYVMLDWFRALGARVKYERGQYVTELTLAEEYLRETPPGKKLKARIMELAERV